MNVVGLQALRIDAEGAVTANATVSINASIAQVITPQGLNQTANVTTVAAATGTAVKASAGFLQKVIVVTSGSAATDIYDNASALSGTIIGAVPASPAIGTVYTFNAQAANGIYLGTTNTSSLTLFWD